MDSNSGFRAPVGTYLKRRSFGSGGGEVLLPLYVAESGLFLFIGYWRGYELSVAAGTWRHADPFLTLDGIGKTFFIDTLPWQEPPRFERTMQIVGQGGNCQLVGLDEPEGWSLLSWRGPFEFVGERYFVDIEEPSVPRAWAEIETWTRTFLET